MRKVGIAVAVVLAVAALVAISGLQGSTPSIPSTNSIASLETVELGGYRQVILVRGSDRANPVLLFLHGGPGMPAMFLAHAFQRPLEKDFIIVHWDRRGAGKSFREESPPSLSVSQLLSDGEELCLKLAKRFRKESIFLVGHSFGTYLGALLVQRRPALFSAYVSIGQVVDEARALQVQGAWLRDEAERRGDEAALAELEQKGAASHEKWLFRFGGELAAHKSWWPLLWAGLWAPEYTWADIRRVARGSSYSSANMKYDVIGAPLGTHVTRLAVPAFFFTGRRDWTTPYPLIEEYYKVVEAPHKELVWFEHSAHFPFFEEPARFADEMRRVRGLVEARQAQQ